MTNFKHGFRIGTACTVTGLICLCFVSFASARMSPVYLGSAACVYQCTPTPLAQHPRKVFVTHGGAVYHIRWTRWGAHTTTGRGTFVSTSGGRSSAKLVASHVISCGHHRVYSRLAWRTRADPVGGTVQFDINGCRFVASG